MAAEPPLPRHGDQPDLRPEVALHLSTVGGSRIGRGPYRISQCSPLAKRKKTQYEDIAQIKHDVQLARGPPFHLQHLFIPGALNELEDDRSVRVVALGEHLQLQVW